MLYFVLGMHATEIYTGQQRDETQQITRIQSLHTTSSEIGMIILTGEGWRDGTNIQKWREERMKNGYWKEYPCLLSC